MFGAELRAQASHVHIDRACTAVEFVAPDLPQQRGPGVDPARARCEEAQQLELLVGQVERATARRHPVRLGVERERPEPRQRAVAAAGTAAHHGQTHAHLGGRCSRVEELVGELVPGVSLDRVALDDEHGPAPAGRVRAAPRSTVKAWAGCSAASMNTPRARAAARERSRRPRAVRCLMSGSTSASAGSTMVRRSVGEQHEQRHGRPHDIGSDPRAEQGGAMAGRRPYAGPKVPPGWAESRTFIGLPAAVRRVLTTMMDGSDGRPKPTTRKGYLMNRKSWDQLISTGGGRPGCHADRARRAAPSTAATAHSRTCVTVSSRRTSRSRRSRP